MRLGRHSMQLLPLFSHLRRDLPPTCRSLCGGCLSFSMSLQTAVLRSAGTITAVRVTAASGAINTSAGLTPDCICASDQVTLAFCRWTLASRWRTSGSSSAVSVLRVTRRRARRRLRMAERLAAAGVAVQVCCLLFVAEPLSADSTTSGPSQRYLFFSEYVPSSGSDGDTAYKKSDI